MVPLLNRKFKFVNYGGTYQLNLETAEDLKAIQVLEDPFWMSTNAPTHQLTSDPVLIAYLDHDGDKRILSCDIRRACKWIDDRLKDWQGVTEGSDTLVFSRMKTETPQGEKLLTGAKHLLRYLGKEDATKISLKEVRNHQAERAQGFNNGDGVIVPAAQNEDADLKTFVEAIIDTMGGADDLNGVKGVDRAQLDGFMKSATELLKWQGQSDSVMAETQSMFPMGKDTARGYDLVRELQGPMTKYFKLCRLKKLQGMFDREMPPSSVAEDVWTDGEKLDQYLDEAPIAPPRADPFLDLRGEINPQYAEAISFLAEKVTPNTVSPDKDPSILHEEEWFRMNNAFSRYQEWLAAKPGGDVEKLGPDRLREYVESDLPGRLRELIDRDEAIGKELESVKDLEILILLQKWFMEVCHNFVSFHNLYDPDKRAMFEIGRLVIGGRIFNLNIKVQDINRHSKLAQESGMLLLYSEVTSADPKEKFHIVTPVTSMTLGRLGPDRYGVLFDVDGREWTVRVLKVVDNPISLWSEMKKPFTRIGKIVSGSFQKVVGGAEKQIGSAITTNLGKAEKSIKGGLKGAMAEAPKKPTPSPTKATPAPARSSSAREWIFSGSVAFAALGSSFAFISKTVSEMKWEKVYHLGLIGLVVLGVAMLLILIPLLLIADYRLQHRNLGSLLEASGWAINAEMRVTRRLAKVLAPKPVHPAGFTKIRKDLTKSFVKKAKQAGNLAASTIAGDSEDGKGESSKN